MCTHRLSPNTAVERVKIRYTLKFALTQNGDKKHLGRIWGGEDRRECN